MLDHLATLTRNDLRYGDVTIPALAEPTPDQRRAFDLIGAAIPLTLTPRRHHKPARPQTRSSTPDPTTSADVTSA